MWQARACLDTASRVADGVPRRAIPHRYECLSVDVLPDMFIAYALLPPRWSSGRFSVTLLSA